VELAEERLEDPPYSVAEQDGIEWTHNGRECFFDAASGRRLWIPRTEAAFEELERMMSSRDPAPRTQIGNIVFWKRRWLDNANMQFQGAEYPDQLPYYMSSPGLARLRTLLDYPYRRGVRWPS
jgi:hypothetical protein